MIAPALAAGSAIGLALGLVGGGGSIMAVPLLVYVVGVGSGGVVALQAACSDARLFAGRRDQSALDREGSHSREDVAAVLCVGDDGLIDEDLEEQVVDIDPLTFRP